MTKNAIAIDRGRRVHLLRTRIAAMKGTEFSTHCGLARGTITNWERGNGKAGLTKKGAYQLMRSMEAIGIDCRVEWLLNGEGDIPRIIDQRKLPRLHFPAAPQASPTIRESSIDGLNDAQEINLFVKHYPVNLVYTFQDDSMTPFYQANDCVAGPVMTFEQLKEVYHRICIVRLKPNHLFVRCLHVHSVSPATLGFYVADAHNAVNYPPITQVPLDSIVAIAPVTRVWKMLHK